MGLSTGGAVSLDSVRFDTGWASTWTMSNIFGESWIDMV